MSPNTSAPVLSDRRRAAGRLVVRPVALADIERATWDRLLAATPWATPFARWTFQRAWWDAYGETAHEQYLLVSAAPSDGEGDVHAIVPLMHRHYAEPSDEPTRTILRPHARPGRALAAQCKTIFFAASYHADYATLLCSPTDLPAVCSALAGYLATLPTDNSGDLPWEVLDLRRLRSGDPALPMLAAALQAQADRHGWRFLREVEDVCPVLSVAGGDWDGYLATLDKQARHEIRRKLRRAEAHGPLTMRVAPPTLAGIDRFIALHSQRWGDAGLFPANPGGARSRLFVRRLAQLESAEPGGGMLLQADLLADQRPVFSALAFDDGETVFLYNAGMDPSARELSPGVTGTALLLQDRLAAGRRRFDFLRGAESYKYEWGGRDEPIERLLVLRDPAVVATPPEELAA